MKTTELTASVQPDLVELSQRHVEALKYQYELIYEITSKVNDIKRFPEEKSDPSNVLTKDSPSTFIEQYKEEIERLKEYNLKLTKILDHLRTIC